MGWIHFTQGECQWIAVVTTVKKLCIPCNFLAARDSSRNAIFNTVG